MAIELKEIVNQISEAIGLPQGYKVSALIDEENENKLVGWTIVKVYDDGKIEPVNKNFNNLKELIANFDTKEVDLEKELKTLDNTLFDLDGVAVQGATHYLTVEDVKDIAKHFYELGLTQKGE